PSGVGNEHFVQPNTLFDYQIRFQNTGSASALKVVVVDTLPAQLDPATLQLGASSHNYNLSIDGYNGRLMLIFTFNGINLPDSSSNLLGSQGFLKFKIAAKADVPLETTISNNAYIYFDYNEPVITNNAWVTIHYFKIDDPIAVTVTPTATPVISIPNDFKLYPNPSKQHSLLDLGKTYENIQVKIETINGQVVYNQQFLQKNQVLLNAEQLDAGIYFVRIITQNQNAVLKWIKQ
ncbi:MAG: T9SS type A sorting domain-containing protein, partial [Chitinophagales bacterium]|nr:T9SS type A sorting domain-containing protein [Chitinophagales bacterium]